MAFTILVTAALTVAVFSVTPGDDFSSSYTVITGWHTANGRYFKADGAKIGSEESIYAKMPKVPDSGDKIIIYSKGLNINLGTRGKEVKKFNGSGYPSFCFVDANDISKNSEISLRLEPTNSGAAIMSPIILTSKNDFIFSTVLKYRGLLAFSALLLLTAAFLIIFALHKARARLHFAAKFARGGMLSALSAIILLHKTTLPLLFCGNAPLVHYLYYTAIMLLPATLCGLYLSLSRKKETDVLHTQLFSVFYYALRMFLTVFGISLQAWAFTYGIITALTVAVIVFTVLKPLIAKLRFNREAGVIRIKT